MQASIVVSKNKSGESTINVSSVANIKIEPIDEDILVILDSEDDVYLIIDLSNTSFFAYRTKTSNSVLVFVDVDKPLKVCNTLNWLVMDLRLNVHLFIILHSLQVLILSMR